MGDRITMVNMDLQALSNRVTQIAEMPTGGDAIDPAAAVFMSENATFSGGSTARIRGTNFDIAPSLANNEQARLEMAFDYNYNSRGPPFFICRLVNATSTVKQFTLNFTLNINVAGNTTEVIYIEVVPAQSLLPGMQSFYYAVKRDQIRVGPVGDRFMDIQVPDGTIQTRTEFEFYNSYHYFMSFIDEHTRAPITQTQSNGNDRPTWYQTVQIPFGGRFEPPITFSQMSSEHLPYNGKQIMQTTSLVDRRRCAVSMLEDHDSSLSQGQRPFLVRAFDDFFNLRFTLRPGALTADDNYRRYYIDSSFMEIFPEDVDLSEMTIKMLFKEENAADSGVPERHRSSIRVLFRIMPNNRVNVYTYGHPDPAMCSWVFTASQFFELGEEDRGNAGSIFLSADVIPSPARMELTCYVSDKLMQNLHNDFDYPIAVFSNAGGSTYITSATADEVFAAVLTDLNETVDTRVQANNFSISNLSTSITDDSIATGNSIRNTFFQNTATVKGAEVGFRKQYTPYMARGGAYWEKISANVTFQINTDYRPDNPVNRTLTVNFTTNGTTTSLDADFDGGDDGNTYIEEYMCLINIMTTNLSGSQHMEIPDKGYLTTMMMKQT